MKHVYDNAQRCLQCENPQCIKGCPVSTPIPEAIKLLLAGDIVSAGELLFKNNPLSIICCHVCPQENQCEGNCVLAKSGAPVSISEIEKYISDYYLNVYKPIPSTKTSGKIAVIGAGPSGMAVAFILSSLNYDVVIFERHAHMGGVLRYGIPEFRLPNTYLSSLKQLLLAKGVTLRQNTTIGRNITIDDIMNDGYKAICICAGVWKPIKLKVKGESFGNIHYAIDYLKKPKTYNLGRSVVVIGSGNTAMDVARTAFRFGSTNVSIICRGDERSVSARAVEKAYAELDGAKFIYDKNAVEFTDDGVILEDTISKKRELHKADSCIIAIGQEPRNVIVSNTTGIEVNERGLVKVDEKGATTRKGIFACGDVTTGARTVVGAVQAAKNVAKEINKYIMSNSLE